MTMNLHHLRLFAAVVNHGGFTKAADSLRLSQPAISKSLNELERQLKLALIDRSGRSIRLTDAGKTLYARARELFGVEWIAEQELREIRGLKRGVLRIGASTTTAAAVPELGQSDSVCKLDTVRPENPRPQWAVAPAADSDRVHPLPPESDLESVAAENS